MVKAFIFLLSVFLSSQLIESKPRYGFRFWRNFARSSIESSEEDSYESCVDCSHTNIGNGYNNGNVIHKNSHPNYKENQAKTDIYQEFGKQNENEGQLATGNVYRTPSKPAYNNFDRNEPQEGDESNYDQRPFKPNIKQVHENRRPYNDYDTNYNRKRTSEIGDFGNGHDNTNTFNIHKKNIYIS